LCTGDQGWLDSEGYLTLTGRIKELINRGGEKISPLEVDSCLLSHPSVVEACCFAVPDEKYGEVVAAAVVLRPEAASEGPKLEEAIKKHCAKTLADFKVPTRVFITNQLPKGPTGKIQRRTMAAFFFPKGEPSSSSPPSGGHQSKL
jgi:acyl-coenzyme A synthetase/AMP-(fatty) acid ligase